MQSLIVIIAFTFLCFLSNVECKGETLKIVGEFGSTYKITERDAYDEILEKVKEKNLDKHFLSLKSKVIYHTVTAHNLGRASENRTYKLDLKFQLPFDIKDHTGKVLYPAGYTFNPLKYIKFPFILVFFDSLSEKEVDWLKKSGMLDRDDVILITTRGNVMDANNILGRTVYLADNVILNYFSVTKTPTVIYQEGEALILKEIGLYEGEVSNKKKNGKNHGRKQKSNK